MSLILVLFVLLLEEKRTHIVTAAQRFFSIISWFCCANFSVFNSPNTFNLTVDDYDLNISMNYWDTYRQTESEELRCIALIKLQILITSN